MSVLVSGGGSRGGSSGLRGYRNRLINGDFAVDQRNAGAAASIAGGGTGFGPDRWRGQSVGGAAGTFYLDQEADGGNYRLLTAATVADASLAATDYYSFGQRLEGYNIRDLSWGTASAQPVTISFEVTYDSTGTFPISLHNSAADRTWLGSFTINAASTRERKTITVPGDTSGTWLTTNGIGINMVVALGAGSNFIGTAGWQSGNLITMAGMTNGMASIGIGLRFKDWQLEAGSTATEYERLPYDVQLMRCQRYYEKSFEMATAPAQNAGIAGAFRLAQVAGASATQVSWVTFNTRKRTAATVTTYNPLAADAQVRNQSTSTNATATSVSGYEDGGYLSFTTVAGSAVSNLNAVHWTADAEL